MGAAIAVVVILMALTGSLLNHTSDLELDQRYLKWDWLLSHYGINQLEPDAVFHLNTKVISQFDQQVFLDATPIFQDPETIVGGVDLDDTFVLATENALLIFTDEGEFVEKMTQSIGIPPMIQNIGLYHGEVVLQTREGMWLGDVMLEQWEKLSLQGVGWSLPQSLPDYVREQLDSYFHGKGISYERVILDIHNGDILGKYGVWLLDGMSFLLIVLSLSGLWMWSRRLR
jgi:hypothetical protein